ncbi:MULTISPECIES: hypothetical protein [Micrococcaceae]|uniref:hypothetical protein n=1 Tax=Micrococcaceae TaxID=1268 RepID=UPI000A7DC6BE|nr:MULTISPECIES: hypothetical protein [Micrococcaceae]
MVTDAVTDPWSGAGAQEAVGHLVSRLAGCSVRVEQVLAGCRDIQLLEWQSPAGQAYREAVSIQAAALAQSLERLAEARAAVSRFVPEVPLSGSSTLAGGSLPGQAFPGWP